MGLYAQHETYKTKHKERKTHMRFNHTEVDKYGSQGGSSYFSLKDDGDVARVRFMYNNADDIDGYAVHEVEIDGRKRYVNCLREYNSRLDDCPFCRERKFQAAKLFIPLYNVDEDKVQIWERGKTYFSIIAGLMTRYASADKPLVSQQFEIERNGKKGDNSTRYSIFPVGQPDDTRLEDLPEVPNPIGTLVLDKSYDDLEYYLENGYFPPDDGGVTRRRGNRETSDSDSESPRDQRQSYRRPERRTPNRRGDEF